ncbi:MAG TPA: archease [Thermoanaerobaculia bacterium]|nr:archease [Thermoanaerobaculia bacterium]HUM31063.1 archease [Thermoanaerobaculia bacterium]HXK69361.1 archease [Thermoanaerobaculia bacterium]
MGNVIHLEQTADMRLRIEGSSLNDLFTTLSLELAREITVPPVHNSPHSTITFVVEGSDEEKAVQLAGELLYLLQVRGSLAQNVEVVPGIGSWQVVAEVIPHGGLSGEIKAATYNDIRFQQSEGRVFLEMTFDR